MSPLAKKGPPDLAIILGSHKPHDGEEHEEEGEGGDNYAAKKDAMEAFIKAVKDDDPEAACQAFDTYADLHASDEDDDDEDKGEEDEDQ